MIVSCYTRLSKSGVVEVKQYYYRKELQYYIQSLSNVELNWKTIFQVQNILDIDKAKQNSLVQSIFTHQ